MAEIKHQVPIDAAPEKVYAALATQVGLRSWWTADAKADEKAGGNAEFGFDKRQMVAKMKIEKLEPGKQVLWNCHGEHPEWKGTTLCGRSRANTARPCFGSPMAVGSLPPNSARCATPAGAS